MAINGVYNVNQMANEINRQLQQYANGVGEDIAKLAEKVAKDGAKRLKVSSPKDTGDYAKGWRAKKLDNGKWVVHNATDYQLTHLLEYGHVNRNGSRSQVKPHIKAVEQDIIKEFENELIRRLGQ